MCNTISRLLTRRTELRDKCIGRSRILFLNTAFHVCSYSDPGPRLRVLVVKTSFYLQYACCIHIIDNILCTQYTYFLELGTLYKVNKVNERT